MFPLSCINILSPRRNCWRALPSRIIFPPAQKRSCNHDVWINEGRNCRGRYTNALSVSNNFGRRVPCSAAFIAGVASMCFYFTFSSSLLFMPWQRLVLLVSLSQLAPDTHSRDGVGSLSPTTGCVPRAVWPLLFLLTATATATPILYLDLKRPPGNLPSWISPPCKSVRVGPGSPW